MANIYNKLKEKGWDENDILKTVNLVEQNKKKKIDLELHYYIILVLIAIANVFASVLIIPVIIKFSPNVNYIYFFIWFISLLFGTLINYALSELELLDDSYSALVLLFLLFVIVFNVSNILEFSNTVAVNILVAIKTVPIVLDPFASGFLILISYLLPYFYYRMKNKNRLIL